MGPQKAHIVKPAPIALNLLVFITVYFVLLSAKEIRQIPKIIHKSKPTMQLAFLVC